MKKTPAIMMQGVSSNAGKSVMAAALCRILFQDGYEVFPFKAQNMALNSCVTQSGGEMGRAQVVQAQACRQDPDVLMNPILLKPTSGTGCQVIVNGKPDSNMDVTDYIEYKKKGFAVVKEAYDELSKKAECIVLEGAGSPAEINLKDHDIVNMHMAAHAESPVLLVGDIDRGGVFASFVGTMELLDQWERDLVSGFIINRFRGDVKYLGNALPLTKERTGKPVLGVVPYINDLGLPEEDSVEFKSGALDEKKPDGDFVEIAIIDLPHISNFTDFDPFRSEPDVHLKVVRSEKELGQPDAVILPGSKNVIHDLKYLRQCGLDKKIIGLSKSGKAEVVGICGGYQMIGDMINDPEHMESSLNEISGLGLLPIGAVLKRDKTLKRTKALHILSGLSVHGYEIHHGQSDTSKIDELITGPGNVRVGAGLEKERVWGTYLHGIFDADEFRRWFVDGLRRRRGLAPLVKIQSVYDVDAAIDRLADVVRESLPIEDIYMIMGLL
jgi:adenosylcobyric acid synthase